MSDLTAFVLARIAEDEAAARLADGVTDKQEDDWQDVTQPLTVADTLKRESWAKKYGYAYEHIARHDPARVLRECEAKRRIVERHRPHDLSADILEGCAVCLSDREGFKDYWDPDPWPCATLRDIASVYSDHPDYREEWKP